MKKLLLLLVSIVIIFTLASCDDSEIVGYHIDENGNLIATYDDNTTVDLGTLTDAIANGVNTITISDDGHYVINGINTDIAAVDIFEVNFVTGYSTTVKTQVVKDGDKVERPQIEREGYTLVGWYCNGEEWRFKSDIVLNDMTLTAKWTPNDYSVSFETGIDTDLSNQTITFDSEYSLPTLEQTGYTGTFNYEVNISADDGVKKVKENYEKIFSDYNNK